MPRTADFKVVVLGSGGVGKSALTVRFVKKVFVERYDPTIEDSYRKQIEVDGLHCMLEILDTAGSEQFTVMRDLYMKNGDGFVLVYSVTAKSTFSEIQDFHDNIVRVKQLSGAEEPPMVLVGNKADLERERQVKTEQGQDLAKTFSCCVALEASAKTNHNVERLFVELVKLLAAKYKPAKKKSGCTLL